MPKFQAGKSGNPGGRPRGSKDGRTRVLEGIKAKFADETAFWGHVAKLAHAGDSEMLKLIAARLAPPLKPRATPIEPLERLPKDLVKRAEALVEAAAKGKLAPEEAKHLLSAVADALKIKELTELEARIAALEEKQP